MASSPETNVEEDHGDVGQMASNNGQEYSPVVDCVPRTRDRSTWRSLVFMSVTSDPQIWGMTKARQVQGLMVPMEVYRSWLSPATLKQVHLRSEATWLDRLRVRMNDASLLGLLHGLTVRWCPRRFTSWLHPLGFERRQSVQGASIFCCTSLLCRLSIFFLIYFYRRFLSK